MDAAGHADAYREVLADMLKARSAYRKLKAVAEYHKLKAGLVITATPVSTNGRTGLARPPSNRFRGVKQIDAAEAVLREAGAPLKTAQIADAMLKHGFDGGNSKKLRNAIFTGMTRKPAVFQKLESGTWTINTPSEQP